MQKKINILHIDDSAMIIALMKLSLLAKDNIKTIEYAKSILDAKSKLQEQNTDVAILDLDLPDGSGMDLLKWIKKECPKTLVIMFSNHADACHRSASKENGADYFFDKIIEFEKVSKLISTLKLN